MKREVKERMGPENADDSAAEDIEEVEELQSLKPGVMERLSRYGFAGLCDF
jgi:hypothetical protein